MSQSESDCLGLWSARCDDSGRPSGLAHKVGRAAAAACFAIGASAANAQFVEHTVATEIGFGYQVRVADMNRDGKPDIIGLGARMSELLWFENPSWEPHVIVSDVSGMINMDAADLDGDGIPEIALAYGFSTRPASSVGNIGILENTGDPTEPWTLKEIDHVPSSHRIRWGTIDDSGVPVLINAPIVNEMASGLEDPEQLPTQLIYYRPGDWEREVVTRENTGAVHGLLPFDFDGDGRDEVLTAGRVGVHAHRFANAGSWSRERFSQGVEKPYPDGGSSDLGAGRLNGDSFFVAIEPFHGNEVVVYRQGSGDQWQRLVIDTELQNGHSLLVAELSGDGNAEIVAAGTRGPKNLYLYRAADQAGDRWERTIIDDAISANSCDASDINGDGRMDVICIDSSAPNAIKWYENTGRW